MTELSDFKQWLIDTQGLSVRTAHTYYKSMGTILQRRNLLAPLREDLAASTKHGYWSALKQWAQFMDDAELLVELNSPAVRRLAMKTGRPARAVEPYTKEEVTLFREALDRLRDGPGVDPWVWPSISLMLRLGLRARVDLCRLQKDSIVEGLRTGKLIIRTKRDKFRMLPTEIVRDELGRLVDIPGWKVLSDVIAPHGSNPESLSYRYVQRLLKQIAGLCGLDPAEIRSHRFRHTAAMDLYEASDHDIHLVQQFLGHSSMQTTTKYLRIDRTDDMNQALRKVKDGQTKSG